MLKVRNIQFVPIGTLNTNVASKSYLDNDSDVGEDDVSQNTSSLATPSRSPTDENRSVSASPVCTPGSITRELTQFDSEPDEQPSTRVMLPVKKRKRLISDRGECELKFPVCDQRTAQHSWRGCSFVNPKVQASGAGLLNQSNYCFLNSVLQSVVHTAQLARYLVEHHDLNNCGMRMPCLYCALKRHIQHVANTPKPTNPNNWMRQFFGKIFPSHRRDYQEDAHEMLTLLLSALEPPLALKKAAPAGTDNCGAGDVAASNGKSPVKSSAAAPSTAIEQIFGGNLRNKITCDDCSTSYVNYEKIREINVGLLPRYQGQEVPLSRLLNDFFGEERLQGFICKKCNGKRSASRNTTVLRSPSVLIIQLKRFNIFGGKNRLIVRPEPILHLDKFMYNKEAERYCFSGVIQHIGGGLNYGHYVSAFRGFDDRSWFYFDDSDVSSFSEQKALHMEPYILFYTKIRNGEPLTPSSIERPLNGFKRSATPQPAMKGHVVRDSPNGSNGFTNGIAQKSSPVMFGPQLPADFGGGSRKCNSVNGNVTSLSPSLSANESNDSNSKSNGETNGFRNSNGSFGNGGGFRSTYNSPTTNGKANGHQNNGRNGYQKNGYRTPNSNFFSSNRKFHHSNGHSDGGPYRTTLVDYGFKAKRHNSDSFEVPNSFGKRQRFSAGSGSSPATSNGSFRSISASPKPSAFQSNSSANVNGNSSTSKPTAAYKPKGLVSFKIAKKQPIRPLNLY